MRHLTVSTYDDMPEIEVTIVPYDGFVICRATQGDRVVKVRSYFEDQIIPNYFDTRSWEEIAEDRFLARLP